ncbi:MAG: class I SAM-dependent methyltransferase, partial [Thermoplasmata archaeon]|nr:class I SAM-dependent methyltransferase [Thermoplasmata archaeon]
MEDPSRLRLLAATGYSSERWLGENAVGEELGHAWDIAERVEADLSGAFTAEEIGRRATGGFPELKEAVLHALVRRVRPSRVVATGVAQGISSYFLLSALEENGYGELHSIDFPQRDPAGSVDASSAIRDRVYVPKGRSTGWLVPAKLRPRWQLTEGRAEEWLPRQAGGADVFFHDSLHTVAHMRLEYEWALDHLSDGGVLVSDDIHWNNAFPRFLSDHPTEFRAISTGFVRQR